MVQKLQTLDSGGQQIPQQAAAPTTPAEVEERTKGWLAYIEDFLGNQENAMPLMQAGLAMLQPTPAGGNAWTNVAGGLGTFVAAKDKQKTEKEKKEDREQLALLRDAQIRGVNSEIRGRDASTRTEETLLPDRQDSLRAGTGEVVARTKDIATDNDRADAQLRASIRQFEQDLGIRRSQLDLEGRRVDIAAKEQKEGSTARDRQLDIAQQEADSQSTYRASLATANGSTGTERIAGQLYTRLKSRNPDMPDDQAYLRSLQMTQALQGKSPAEVRAELIKSMQPETPAELQAVEQIVSQLEQERQYPGAPSSAPSAPGGQVVTGEISGANTPASIMQSPEYMQAQSIVNARTDLSPAQKAALLNQWVARKTKQ